MSDLIQFLAINDRGADVAVLHKRLVALGYIIPCRRNGVGPR